MNETRRQWIVRTALAMGVAAGFGLLPGCGGDEVPDGVATPTPELEVDESKSKGFQSGPKPGAK